MDCIARLKVGEGSIVARASLLPKKTTKISIFIRYLSGNSSENVESPIYCKWRNVPQRLCYPFGTHFSVFFLPILPLTPKGAEAWNPTYRERKERGSSNPSAAAAAAVTPVGGGGKMKEILMKSIGVKVLITNRII